MDGESLTSVWMVEKLWKHMSFS